MRAAPQPGMGTTPAEPRTTFGSRVGSGYGRDFRAYADDGTHVPSPMVVGIIGATGAVGVEMIDCLYTRKFPLTKLVLFGSERSAGKTVDTPYGPIKLEPFSVEACHKCHVVLMAVSV